VNDKSAEKNTIGFASGTKKTNRFTCDWTVGESVIQTITNKSRTLTQGFHQPNVLLGEIIHKYDMKIWPNPLPEGEKLTLEIDNQDIIDFSVEVINVMGHTVHVKNDCKSKVQYLDLNHLAAGSYMLRIVTIQKIVVAVEKFVKL
jgi:hypothetical protein